MFYSHRNLAQSLLASVPADRTSGTNFTVAPGDGFLFAPNMPVTLAPYGKDPSYDNAEIARIISVTGDAVVLERGTEGSIPKIVQVGWVIAGTVTAGTLEAIEDVVLTKADQTYVDDLVDGLDLSGNVKSVAGRTGDVVLSKADVGLNMVDNTSDAAKPVSTATQTALNAKYNASNPAGYVDAFQAAASAPVQSVAGKQGAVTLAKGDVGLGNVDNTSDASKPVSTATSSALALKADLIAGQVPTSQIPAVALTKGQAVASRAAMLALADVQEGDIVSITTGTDKGTYMLGSGASTVFSSWMPLTAPTDVVTSVNGQQGTIVLAKGDIGLGSVDNTSDANKPVSTSQAAAIALKENASNKSDATDLGGSTPSSTLYPAQAAVKAYVDTLSSGLDATVVHLTGAEAISGVKTFSSSPIVPTPSTSTQAANKLYADTKAADINTVHLSNTETVTGLKTFTANADTIILSASNPGLTFFGTSGAAGWRRFQHYMSGSAYIFRYTNDAVTVQQPIWSVTPTSATAFNTVLNFNSGAGLSGGTVGQIDVTGSISLPAASTLNALGPVRYGVAGRAANITLTAASQQIQTCDASTGAFAVTLPTVTYTGLQFTIVKTDSSANAVTVTPAGTGNIGGYTTYPLTMVNDTITMISTGTGDVWRIVNNSTTATPTTTGVIQLTGDLGGTAIAPTTPTAVHLTGAETITGSKTFTAAIVNNSSVTGAGVITTSRAGVPSQNITITGGDAAASFITNYTNSANKKQLTFNSITNDAGNTTGTLGFAWGVGNAVANSGTTKLMTLSTDTGLKLTSGVVIDMSATKIISVADPTAPQDAATKNYVDTLFSSGGGGTGITRNVIRTSANYTVAATALVDCVYIVTGAHTGTLPSATGNSNRYTFKNRHTAAVTLSRAGSDTIEGDVSITIQPSNSVDLISNGLAEWEII